MKAKKQEPCHKWMHHVWLPKRKELEAKNLTQAEQTCSFCEGKRILVFVKNEDEEE